MSAEAVISALRAAGVDTVVGCDIHPRAWLATASLVDAFVQVPLAADVGAYLKAIDTMCREHRVELIMPLTDPEVDFYAAHWVEGAGGGAIPTISKPQAVSLCRDKWLLHNALVNHPEIRVIPTRRVLESDLAVQDLPAIAKPRRGRSSEGVLRFTLDGGFERIALGARCTDYIVQPLIKGDVYTVDVVRQAERGETAAVARRELIRSSNGAGLTVEVGQNPRLETLSRRLATELDLRGCVNFEFIRHGNEYFLMDVNPRVSAGVGFTQIAGYEPVVNHVRCFLGAAIEFPPAIPTVILSKRYREFRC